MSPRNSRTLALSALVLMAALAAAAAPCKPNPGGKPWETKIVYLEFKGCARAEPDKPFDLTLGNERIIFRKDSPTAQFWRGEAAQSFPIGSRTLTVDLVDMRARTACNVAAESYDAGNCVALYRIQCEELWMLSIRPVPPDAPVTIRYERAPLPAAYAACTPQFATPEGPAELELGDSESIVINVENLPNGPVKVPLSRQMFRGGRTTLKLRDIAPQAVSKNSAVSTNVALKALKKGQLKLVLEDLLFTKN